MRNITTPTELETLVVFSDLTNFYRHAKTMSDGELFEWISAYFEMAGEIIEDGGGTVVKTIGDAILFLFPEDKVDEGVKSLILLQEKTKEWMEGRRCPCQAIIKAHFGPVVVGPVGTKSNKRFDVYGKTVNNAARLQSHGLALTPQVFRKLSADTRKLFKKHTPPYRYIPLAEHHRD
mgnify:CR=1 FL=1